MAAIFDFLYREYCRARLAEMRQQLLLVPGPAAPETNGADAAAEILAKRAPDMGIDLIKPVVRELNAMKVWGVDGGNDSEVLRFTSTAGATGRMRMRLLMPVTPWIRRTARSASTV